MTRSNQSIGTLFGGGFSNSSGGIMKTKAIGKVVLVAEAVIAAVKVILLGRKKK